MNEIILKIIEILNAGVPADTYKKIFYGENVAPEQSIFPFIEVIGTEGVTEGIGTGGLVDEEFQITITVKDTIKNTLKEDTNATILEYDQIMKKRIEERDSERVFLPTTIIGILRANLTLDGLVTFNDSFVRNYENLPQLNGSYIAKASITFTGHYRGKA